MKLLFFELGCIIFALCVIIEICGIISLLVNYILMKKSLQGNLANYSNYCLNFDCSLGLILACLRYIVATGIYLVIFHFI